MDFDNKNGLAIQIVLKGEKYRSGEVFDDFMDLKDASAKFRTLADWIDEIANGPR